MRRTSAISFARTARCRNDQLRHGIFSEDISLSPFHRKDGARAQALLRASDARLHAAFPTRVVVIDFDRAELQEASAELPEDRLLIQPSDTSGKDAAVAAINAAVNRFDGLDVLVDNAGIASKGDITRISDEDFGRVLASNGQPPQ